MHLGVILEVISQIISVHFRLIKFYEELPKNIFGSNIYAIDGHFFYESLKPTNHATHQLDDFTLAPKLKIDAIRSWKYFVKIFNNAGKILNCNWITLLSLYYHLLSCSKTQLRKRKRFTLISLQGVHTHTTLLEKTCLTTFVPLLQTHFQPAISVRKKVRKNVKCLLYEPCINH